MSGHEEVKMNGSHTKKEKEKEKTEHHHHNNTSNNNNNSAPSTHHNKDKKRKKSKADISDPPLFRALRKDESEEITRFAFGILLQQN